MFSHLLRFLSSIDRLSKGQIAVNRMLDLQIPTEWLHSGSVLRCNEKKNIFSKEIYIFSICHSTMMTQKTKGIFSLNRPTGPIRSSSRDVRVSVCLMSLFIWYILRPILPPLPEVGCPKCLEVRNPWGKVMERSGLRIELFCWDVV